MAIFHHLFSVIERGGHTCAMATAAYRSGSKLTLRTNFTSSGKEEDVVFDFSTKKGIGFSRILTLNDMPVWAQARESLWQHVEDSKSQINDALACESVFALPQELSLEQNSSMVMEYSATVLLPIYSIVDINIHIEHPNNPHVHLMSPIISFDSMKNHIETIETGFVELVNKHLGANGYSSTISNKPMGSPRYDELRPWL